MNVVRDGMSEEFDRVPINLIYEAEREQEAKGIAGDLERLGAVITFTKVDDGKANRKHGGKVYYFRREKVFSQMAARLAEIFSKVESLTPEFHNSKSSVEIEYSIWLVKNPRRGKASAPKVIKRLRTYEVCSICNVSIRSDRVRHHKAHVHLQPVTDKGAKKTIGVASRKGRCRHCGKIAIPGSDTCYSCS
jgi:hypothetical protein